MSKKSGPSSRKRKARTGDFDRALWKKAVGIAARYRLILEVDERLGYIGSSIEMPTVFADGKTPDACVKAVREALTVAVATMLENGRRPPTSAARRSVQVNVRLTPDEKLALEEAAAHMGFKGLSEYIRHTALDHRRTA